MIVPSVTREVVDVRHEQQHESKHVEGTRHIRMMPALAMPKRNTSNQDSDGQEEPINRGRTKESKTEGAKQAQGHAGQHAMHGADRARTGSQLIPQFSIPNRH